MMVPGHSQGLCNLNFVEPKGESPQACSSGCLCKGQERKREDCGSTFICPHKKWHQTHYYK